MGIEGPHSIEQEIEKMYFDELALEKRAFINYGALEGVCKKGVTLGEIELEFHFNPARVRSVMAKVDEASIKSRQCFLCPEGIGAEQLTTDWISPATKNGYWFRVNPFPIFHKHFTISANVHTKQQIAGRYGDMLALTDVLPNYVVFYNGPKCGASAPDHFHFQAFPKGHLPVEKMISRKCGYKRVIESDKCSVYEIDSYIRGGYVIVSQYIEEMEEKFGFICDNGTIHTTIKEPDEKPVESPEWEPRMNVVSWKSEGKYTTIVFCREMSRPLCFWDEREGFRVFISPGTVEMGGLMLTSDLNTFENTTWKLLSSILEEVSLQGKEADKINILLKNHFCKI